MQITDTWNMFRFPKNKQLAYKQLEKDGIIRVDGVTYYKDTKNVLVRYESTQDLHTTHELLKQAAELF